jgi:hypothetical protein
MSYNASIDPIDFLNPGHGYVVKLHVNGAEVLNTDKDPATGNPLLCWNQCLDVLNQFRVR